MGARTAAYLAGAPSPVVEAMDACGRHVGLAFQMHDDLLDVEGETAVTGKPRGIDLRDGNPSLPIVLALARDPELQQLFATPDLPPAEIERGLARIRRSGVLPVVEARAAAELEQAVAAIDTLRPSPARSALQVFARTLAERRA